MCYYYIGSININISITNVQEELRDEELRQPFVDVAAPLDLKPDGAIAFIA